MGLLREAHLSHQIRLLELLAEGQVLTKQWILCVRGNLQFESVSQQQKNLGEITV